MVWNLGEIVMFHLFQASLHNQRKILGGMRLKTLEAMMRTKGMLLAAHIGLICISG